MVRSAKSYEQLDEDQTAGLVSDGRSSSRRSRSGRGGVTTSPSSDGGRSHRSHRTASGNGVDASASFAEGRSHRSHRSHPSAKDEITLSPSAGGQSHRSHRSQRGDGKPSTLSSRRSFKEGRKELSVSTSQVYEEEAGTKDPSPQSSSSSPSSVQPMIEVVAPAALPEGYQFEASIGENRKIRVTVPKGGVEAGQSFAVPMPKSVERLLTSDEDDEDFEDDIPVGHWRDGFFTIFSAGLCHPHIWTSFCCTMFAVGQVISRLEFTWKGTPGSPESKTVSTYWLFLGLTIIFWVVYLSLSWLAASLDPNYDEDKVSGSPYEVPPASWWLVAVIHDLWYYTFFFLTVLIMSNTRTTLREKYDIPPETCGCGYEDFLCSCLCPCFTVAQMLRHTADYDEETAACCTERGLSRAAVKEEDTESEELVQ